MSDALKYGLHLKAIDQDIKGLQVQTQRQLTERSRANSMLHTKRSDVTPYEPEIYTLGSARRDFEVA